MIAIELCCKYNLHRFPFSLVFDFCTEIFQDQNTGLSVLNYFHVEVCLRILTLETYTFDTILSFINNAQGHNMLMLNSTIVLTLHDRQ